MSSSKIRTASCACGHLKATATGGPERVSSCSCTDCQKRTGSAFGVTAFFKSENVELVSGEPKTFKRTADSGNTLSMSFCPNCGTTLMWHLADHPGMTVVAVGCFTDPDFPAPERNVWAKNKFHWVEFPAGVKLYDESP